MQQLVQQLQLAITEFLGDIGIARLVDWRQCVKQFAAPGSDGDDGAALVIAGSLAADQPRLCRFCRIRDRLGINSAQRSAISVASRRPLPPVPGSRATVAVTGRAPSAPAEFFHHRFARPQQRHQERSNWRIGRLDVGHRSPLCAAGRCQAPPPRRYRPAPGTAAGQTGTGPQRRAGGNQVAGFENKKGREVADQVGKGKHEIGGGVVLALFPVDPVLRSAGRNPRIRPR